MSGTTRGTTPVHTFTVDLDLTNAEVVYLTYKQGSTTLIEKAKDELEITATTLLFKLTQEETLKLKNVRDVEIQIRARFPDGTAVASNIMDAPVLRILKEGVI